MNFAHLFEAAMLVCFGVSWPLNVMKAYRARTAKGTSLPFIILIITGYVAGITAKIINGQFNYVLAVYFLNLAIVMTNVFVYIRNKALDKKAEAKNSLKITANDIKNVVEKEETMMNYTNSLDEYIHKPAVTAEKKNAVILRDDPQNYDARAEVMWAGSLAHNGLTGCGNDGGDWMTHKLEHELGGLYDVAHGAGLAAIWAHGQDM
jgi:alcohol dehydrogenase class IV